MSFKPMGMYSKAVPLALGDWSEEAFPLTMKCSGVRVGAQAVIRTRGGGGVWLSCASLCPDLHALRSSHATHSRKCMIQVHQSLSLHGALGHPVACVALCRVKTRVSKASGGGAARWGLWFGLYQYPGWCLQLWHRLGIIQVNLVTVKSYLAI